MWKVLALLLALSDVQAAQIWQPAYSKARPTPSDGVASDRIVGGDEASPGQFPYQVGVWVHLSVSGSAILFCGGSVLTTNVVLTAGHCAFWGHKFRLVFGAYEIHKEAGTVVRETRRKLVHKQFKDDGHFSNDIALLHFDGPIEFNDRIQPVKLPASANNQYDNAKVTMSGWGLRTNHQKDVTPVLHYVESRVISNANCKPLFEAAFVKPTNICASGWRLKGTCHGDSGGPLVVFDKPGEPTQVGITSFATSYGCYASWPSVFTRVGSYLQWISDGIASFKQVA